MKAVARLNEVMKGRILVSGGSRPYVSVRVDDTKDTIKTLRNSLVVLAAAGKQA